MAQQVTNQIADQLFNSINKTLTQDDIESLHLLFDKLLLPALDIIDNGKVTKLQHPTLFRSYYQVASTSSPLHSYTLFWNQPPDSTKQEEESQSHSHQMEKQEERRGFISSFCPCPDFQIKMWLSSEAGPSATPILMCKHLLAARIASRLDRITTFKAENEDEFLGTLIWNPKS